MKKLLMICLLAMIPNLAMANGPDGRTLSTGTGGAVLIVNADPEDSATPQTLLYVTCAASGFTFSAWRLDRYDKTPAFPDGTWQRVVFTGLASPDTAHVIAGLTVPIQGKFDLIWFDMDVGTEDIDILAYQE